MFLYRRICRIFLMPTRRYHKIKKREKLKRQQEELERLQEIDPDAARVRADGCPGTAAAIATVIVTDTAGLTVTVLVTALISKTHALRESESLTSRRSTS
jgi:hypothetical protein